MTKRIAGVLAVLVLAGCLGQLFAWEDARASTRSAKAQIRREAMSDRPSSITMRCHRDRHRVACWVVEFGAHPLIEDNGEPIVATVSYEATAKT